MLIYSEKLKKHIEKHILPKILLISGNYSTYQGEPLPIYLTDFHVAQVVYPKINPTNIYEAIIKTIKKIDKDDEIFITTIKCGTDDRFQLFSIDKNNTKHIRSLLDDKEKEKFDYIIKKYQTDLGKQLLKVNEFLEPFYRLDWSTKEIIDDAKKLRGNKKIKFSEVLAENAFFMIECLTKLNTQLIGINTIIIYQPYDRDIAQTLELFYQLHLSIPSKKDYYLLYLLGNFFRNAENKEITNEIDTILEKTLGLYKQLIFIIDGYQWLYQNNFLDIETAKGIIANVLNDIPYIPDFKSNVPDKLRDVATNNTPATKMHEWGILLTVLHFELGISMNSIAKGYFDNYLNKLEPYKKKNFYKKIGQIESEG